MNYKRNCAHIRPNSEMETFLFTFKFVNDGHPDKLFDQISDIVLYACFAQDPDNKVVCETCTKTNMAMVFWEITTRAEIDYEKIVRDTSARSGSCPMMLTLTQITARSS